MLLFANGTDTLANAFFATTLAGWVLIALSIACWKSVGAYVADHWSFWAKLFLEGVQLIAAGVALTAAYAAAEDKPSWWRPSIAAAACVATWKVLQILIDWRIKSAEKSRKDEIDAMRKQLEQWGDLLGVLRAGVGHKVTRLATLIGERKTGRIEYVRAALTPEPHLRDLLESIAAYFCRQLPEPEQKVCRFRVAVYVAKDGAMKPVHAIDSRAPGANPLSSWDCSFRDIIQVMQRG